MLCVTLSFAASAASVRAQDSGATDRLPMTVFVGSEEENYLRYLQSLGLVERYPDPDDRRGVIVRLTPEGRTCVDGAFGALLDAERALLDDLSERDRTKLAGLLRTLLVPFSEPD